MKNVYGLDEWILDKNVSNSKRFADVKIMLAYPFPDQKVLIDLKPKERVKEINKGFKKNLKLLLASAFIDDWEAIDNEKKPRGIKAKIKFINLKKLHKLDFISSIWIISIDDAIKVAIEPLITEKYFCVKMTLVTEIEGILLKKQKIEKRFVMIKASSFDDAYEKIEKRKDDYAVSFLNPNGRFVRWRVDSFDDCYETDITNPDDIAQSGGVEVFSALKSRKNKSKNIWDGKF